MSLSDLPTDSSSEEIPLGVPFDELLQDATSMFKYIGQRELKQLADIFELELVDLHLLYMHKLALGIQLPPLVVSAQLLEASGV